MTSSVRYIEISNCYKCPYRIFLCTRADSVEEETYTYSCGKFDKKIICSDYKWKQQDIEIPDWCPLLRKEDVVFVEEERSQDREGIVEDQDIQERIDCLIEEVRCWGNIECIICRGEGCCLDTAVQCEYCRGEGLLNERRLKEMALVDDPDFLEILKEALTEGVSRNTFN